jgi:putative oxygen-independent coproporphyrinogen III oxidase
VIPSDRTSVRDFGVYVHIPFCSARCDYCAFATWTDRSHLMDSYVDAVCADLDRVLGDGDHPPATSVFFGGGTPSLLPGSSLVRILRSIPMVDGVEVTVECNPETVSPELFGHYVDGGVTRISFGVQSMVPAVLDALGRQHDPMAVVQGIADARAAGINRINLDLIYGGAGETIDQWRTTLDSVVDLGPDHVSAYALTVEAGTPLADDPARHPDDDDQADKYLLAEAVLSAAGLHNYEISNWASAGQECAHNLLYWAQGDYLGFGCAAHSHLDGRRWWNVRTPDRYISCVAAGESVEAASETLGEDTRRIEGLQLALRTDRGVPAGTLAPEDREQLEHLIVDDGDRVRLTVEGRLMANEVAVRLR